MFEPLLVDFLHRTKLHLSQLAPNLFRIILGVAEINRRFGMQLDFWDVMYCYSLSYVTGELRWNLKGRIGFPALVLGLWDSCKYMYADSVIIKGDVEPNPVEYPVLEHHGSPGKWLFPS